jgi:hypothetical protein
MYMSVLKSGDAKTYNSGNQYIVSETVTYTPKCTNTSSNTSTSPGANPVTAFGQGGWNQAGTGFVACNPTFAYTLVNPPTTSSSNHFTNIGQDNMYAAGQSNFQSIGISIIISMACTHRRFYFDFLGLELIREDS